MKIPGNHGQRPPIHALVSTSHTDVSRARAPKHEQVGGMARHSLTAAVIREAIRHAPRAGELKPSTSLTTGTTPAALPAPPSEPLTIEGLLRNWGEAKDSTYDLNSDGKVDAADLAALLATLSEISSPSTSASDAGDSPPQDAKSQIDALLAAWGTNDPKFDLDGDGTVGAADLASLLAQLGPQPPAQPDATSTAQVTGEVALGPELVDPSEPPSAQPQTKVDALLSAWGTSNGDFDFNGDGTVGAADLAELLAQSSPAQPPVSAGAAPPSTVVGATASVSIPAPTASGESGPASAAHAPARPAVDTLDRADRVRLAHLSNQLYRELRERGFHHRPPMNIREIVSGLDLSQIEQKFLMSRLAKRYPRGLGLNAVA